MKKKKKTYGLLWKHIKGIIQGVVILQCQTEMDEDILNNYVTIFIKKKL